MKCKDCKYISVYQDGDVEYQVNGVAYGSSHEIIKCKFEDDKKFNFEGETVCRIGVTHAAD